MITLYKKYGKLTKISDNKNDIRQNCIPGYFHVPPTVGFIFLIISKSLTPGIEFREVRTSLITETLETNEEQNVIIFQTANSKYLLEIFSDSPVYL